MPLEGIAARAKEPAKKEALPLKKKLKVLVVDDEPLVHEVIQGYLIGDGHTADSVMSAAEGLKKIDQNSYDLIITDWAMPQMNGGEFSAIVKKKFPGMAIIMLTGFGELMKTRGEKLESVNVLLSKPLTMDELRQAMGGIFSDGR